MDQSQCSLTVSNGLHNEVLADQQASQLYALNLSHVLELRNYIAICVVPSTQLPS